MCAGRHTVRVLFSGEPLMANKDVTPGRCVNCRAEVMVPNTFADGDTTQCGVCGTSLKVQRSGGALRLPIADVAPLRDEIKSIQLRLRGLEADMARARASFGIGANGLGLGVIYVVYQVALNDQELSRGLLWGAAAVALVGGILLELANLFFLAKRREMSRLSGEIAEAQQEIQRIQTKIRESLRR